MHAAIPFRGLSASLKILEIHSNFGLKKTPSYSTTRRWINRLGLYQLKSEKEKADDWFYITDNSVRIEKRKLCLILGTRLSKLKSEGALQFQDLEILEMGLIEGKTTICVAELLEAAISKTGAPVGICSDQGNSCIFKKHIEVGGKKEFNRK